MVTFLLVSWWGVISPAVQEYHCHDENMKMFSCAGIAEGGDDPNVPSVGMLAVGKKC